METILLTGWTWYIGSHWAVRLLELWYDVIILDNLSNSDFDVIGRIKQITWKTPKFYEIDLKNKLGIEKVFNENNIELVIHFAWYKAVWESCKKPFEYYENNVIWTLNLLEIMDNYWVKNIIFSSSATVYDSFWKSPFHENSLVWNTTNPYWTTKFIIENILRDLSNHKWFKVINLRYFNPIWAHSSWLIWENPNDIPNNLLPYVMKVAIWELQEVKVFWWDYKTKDWTWERDYIHVADLIEGHIKSMEYLEKNNSSNWLFEVFNLWTWKATSVLEVIKIVKKITWIDIKYKITSRRSWDLAICYCNPEKANKILLWKANYYLEQAIKDSWNFIKNTKL